METGHELFVHGLNDMLDNDMLDAEQQLVQALEELAADSSRLRQTLKEEKAALKKMEASSEKVKPNLMMSEAQREASQSNGKRHRNAA